MRRLPYTLPPGSIRLPIKNRAGQIKEHYLKRLKGAAPTLHHFAEAIRKGGGEETGARERE